MKFTFGIITDGSCPGRVRDIMVSIRRERVPGETIVVGGKPIGSAIHIPFDENAGPPAWLARKKNLITHTARCERIVYLHDYVALKPGWYDGFRRFGDDWLACMTPIKNADGSRFRAWCLDQNAIGNTDCLLPYDVQDLSYYQYFSGAYWVAKRELMQKFPLDESLSGPPSRGEDVIWSRHVSENGYKFHLNTFSSVRLLKYKDPVLGPASPAMIDHLRTAKPKRRPLHLEGKVYL